jgi:hypothetical protein
VRFLQNDAVSYIQKKKEQNGVVLNDTVPLSSSPRTLQQGRRKKGAFV